MQDKMDIVRYILFGFCIGSVFGGWFSENSYKNCLIMTAKLSGHEKIKGKWYEIKEMKENE